MTKEQASQFLSNRVLVQTAPRRRQPEHITVAELRALDIPPGTVVRNACFSCEVPDSEPFPPTMRGVRFYNCNLDNVKLPPGNPDLGDNERCSKRRFRAHPDGRDWEIDAQGNYLQPLGGQA